MLRLPRIIATVVGMLISSITWAQASHDEGVTDKEIRIGNTIPYSGPLSAYGTVGKAMSAYFQKINADGGVNGRTIKLLSLDDAYNPTNTVSQTRKLVEGEKVFLMFSVLGTPPNLAIRSYLNQKKVPQLFGLTGQTQLGNYAEYPYTMGWQPSFQAEAKIYVKHLLETNPKAKIAILFQNGDYGKDFKQGLSDALGEKWKTMVVAEASFEATDPIIDTQIVSLRSSGADTLFIIATPKFAAQAIRKTAQLGWKPTQYLNGVANSISSVMKPAGAETIDGIITSFYAREPSDPQWAETKEYQDWLKWMKEYYPAGDVNDNLNVYGYNLAQTLVQVFKQMGNDMTRANAMKQATNLDMSLPMLLPGIRVKTGPNDYFPLQQMQLARWSGKAWDLFGKVYSER